MNEYPLTHQTDIICPYCGLHDRVGNEHYSSGPYLKICNGCDETFFWRQIVSSHFISTKISEESEK